MSEFVYPLNGEQNYTAEQTGAFNGTRTSGVWSGEDNLTVSVTGTRQLTLSKGLAWFTTDGFWGKVYCNTGNINFQLPTADGALDRICRVVIRWNKTTNTGAAMLLTGALASSPTAPERSTTDEMYDLVIADYRVQHGEIEASASRLIDQRLNESLCGLMRDAVTRIPTAALEAQVTALLGQMQENLTQILTGQIADGAVTLPKLADEVTAGALGGATLDSDGKVTAEQASSGIVEKSASFTLDLSLAGKLILANVSSAITVTIPANASVAFPIGTEIEICQFNVGAVSFNAASGVSLWSLGGAKKTAGEIACAVLKKVRIDSWLLSGAIE